MANMMYFFFSFERELGFFVSLKRELCFFFFCFGFFFFFKVQIQSNREKRFNHGSQNRAVEPRFKQFPAFLA